MRQDEGAIQTLEAVLVAVLLVTAVTFVVTFTNPTAPTEVPRTSVGNAASDVLAVMHETPFSSAAYGDNWLSRAIARCMTTRDCSLLVQKTTDLLPRGARFNVWLSNGYDDFPVYVPDLPRGETVVATRYLEPKWSFTFLGLDFNYTDASSGKPLSVVALPVQNSNVVTDGGAELTVTVTGTRSDGGNVSFTATASTTALAADRETVYPGASLTFRDWDGAAAGAIDASNFTSSGGAPTLAALPLRLRLDNAAGAASVPAGAKVRVELPRDWSAVARQTENAGWRVLANASDWNGTHERAFVEAELADALAGSASRDLLLRATYRGTAKEFYLFTASARDGVDARSEAVVKANALASASRVDSPVVAFTAPRPFGPSAARTWTLALSAALVDATGLADVDVRVTRVEVRDLADRDVFAAAVTPVVNTADGAWAKVGRSLVWTGHGTANRAGAFELTWTVAASGTASPSGSRGARPIPLAFENGYEGRLSHQAMPGLYAGDVFPYASSRPGYDSNLSGLTARREYSTDVLFRTFPLRGFDNYSVGAAPTYRDASAGGYFRPSAREVPAGGEVSLEAEAQSLLLRLSELGRSATGTMRLYPPFAVDEKRPIWENRSLDTTLLASDVASLLVLDQNGDGTDDVLVGTTRGRVLAIDGRSGQRVPGVAFTAPSVGDVATAVTTLDRATLDGRDLVIAGTDGNGPYVHALDVGLVERARWNKSAASAVIDVDATVDVTGDGVTDVLVALGDWNVYALSGRATAHGYFDRVTPTGHPGDAFHHRASGRPDGGLAGLAAMGPWREAGYATGVSTLGALPTNVTINANDPVQQVLALAASIPVPRTGVAGVNENGSVVWTLPRIATAKILPADANADGVADAIAASPAGYVVAVNGSAGNLPASPITLPGAGTILDAHSASGIEHWFVTSLGALGGTDDGFVTTFCACAPGTGAIVPLASAAGVGVDPADRKVWVVGAASTTWTGSKAAASRTVTTTPLVWNVDASVRGCTVQAIACLPGTVTLGAHQMNDVHFEPGGRGFIVGDACGTPGLCKDSLVLTRSAPGQTWEMLGRYYTSGGTGTMLSASNDHVTASLKEVEFATPTVGWILGAGGTLLRTTDGGVHWKAVPLPAALASSTVTDVACAPGDVDACWIVATDGATPVESTVVYRTAAATTTTSASDWASVPIGSTRAVRAIGLASATTAYLAGSDVLLATWNGGVNWTKTPLSYVRSSFTEAFALPDGSGVFLGGDDVNGVVTTLRDHRASARAESDVVWSCSAPCEITDVTIDVDASNVLNATGLPGTWVRYSATTTTGDGGWTRFPLAEGTVQARGVEKYDRVDFAGAGGRELRWRADLEAALNMTAFSPVVRELRFLVNHTAAGVPQPTVEVVQTFAGDAAMDAARTSAEWNTTLGALRLPPARDLWWQDVGGAARDAAVADITGDGVADVVVGTGDVLSGNDPANWVVAGADAEAALAADDRVYALDGAASGARLWRSGTLGGDVRHVAVANLSWPRGAPDRYLDVVAVTWDATTSTGEMLALAGRDGAIIWRVPLAQEPVALDVGEDPDEPGKPLPLAGGAAGLTGSGYVYAHGWEDGALRWRGIPEERGRYNVTVGIPKAMPFGPYVMEFELAWNDTVTAVVSGVTQAQAVVQAARFYNYFTVVPPTAPMPISPIYTVKLVTWLGDWDFVSTGRAGGGGTDGATPGSGGGAASGSSADVSRYGRCMLDLCRLASGSEWLVRIGQSNYRVE